MTSFIAARGSGRSISLIRPFRSLVRHNDCLHVNCLLGSLFVEIVQAAASTEILYKQM